MTGCCRPYPRNIFVNGANDEDDDDLEDGDLKDEESGEKIVAS